MAPTRIGDSIMKRFKLMSLAVLAASSLWHVSAQESDLKYPPYNKDLRSNTALSDMTVIDVNNDGKTWTASTVGARYNYHRTNAGDDWLITPGIVLEPGKGYELTVIIGSYNSYNEEQFEIYLGTAPTAEGMTKELVGPTKTTNPYKNNPEVKAMVEVEEAGTYYIGIHAISEKNKMSLYCLNIALEQGFAATAPETITDVTVLGEPTGANQVDISFKAPVTDVMGNPIVGNVTVKMQRDGEDITSWTVAPGEQVNYTDMLEHRGLFTYRLVPYNENGDDGRPYVAEKVYVGPYSPVAPTGVTVKMSENPGYVIVSWDPVDTDVNGTKLSAENITYQLYSKSKYGMSTPFLESFPETSKEIQALSDLLKQAFVSYCVGAFNRSQPGDYSAMSPLFAMGTPYAMPVVMSASGNDYVFGSDNTGGVEWSVAGNIGGAESQDGDGMVYAGIGDKANATGELHTGRIDLTGAESPMLEFYTYKLENDDRNTITVFVKDENNQLIELGVTDHATLPAGEWSRARYSLDAYRDKTIQVVLRARIVSVSHTLVDNLSIKEGVKFDAAAMSATAPSKVAPGEKFNVVYVVKNDGVKSISGATLAVYRNGEDFQEIALPDMAPGETSEYPIVDTLSLFDEIKTEYSAEVILDGDGVEENNTFPAVFVTRKVNPFDGVSGLAGEKTSDGNLLTWIPLDPDSPQAMEMTDDLESAEPFADEYGDWTLLDRDGKGIGYMIDNAHGYQIPNHPSEQPAGFFVWDHNTSRFAGPCHANSGTKFFASVYNFDISAVEDWAISPLLSGRAQTISFNAATFESGADGSHLEKIQIWYADTDTTDPDDFVMLEDFGDNGTYSVPCIHGSDNSSIYTKVEADLPEGAMRFAIVAVTADGWMLMIDDITYTPEPAVNPLVHTGYHVYRDSQRLTTEPVTEPMFLDTAPVKDDHVYHVTAVYEPGESEVSEPYSFYTSGILGVDKANAGMALRGNTLYISGAFRYTVVTPDGRVIANGNGSQSISLASGLYLITIDGKTTKCLVK